MKHIYDLTKDSWREDFFYVWGPQAKTRKTFTERANDNWVRNCEGELGFDYISPLSKDKYSIGTTVSATCRFFGDGAPLIVISDDIVDNTDATPMYRLHFEVVVYKGGINVWRIIPRPETPAWPVASTKLLGIKFPIPDGEEQTLTVKISKGKLTITLGQEVYTVECDELPESFHIGFTACEGACEFGSFSIDGEREINAD